MEPLNKELSHWKTHEYKRRSVSMVESFVGWPIMEGLVKKCDTPRDQALVCALMETGGRISEVLQLNSNMMLEEKNHIIIRAMPVFKRFEKIGKDEHGKWITKKIKRYRTFPIPKKEPLLPIFYEWMKNSDGKLFSIGRKRAYQIITGIDPSIWNHWFRAQRASQLASEYGFTIHDLIDFFNWKDLSTAIHYSRMGWKGLASKMV